MLYRRRGQTVEVFLVHPGGPFWSKKDTGAWSIPKGETEPNEELLAAAKREFTEEVGLPTPAGDFIDLGGFKRKDGKQIFAWAVEGDLDAAKVVSNSFEMEWPPRSGQQQSFPEIDKAAWFNLTTCAPKLHKGQALFMERLAEKLQLQVQAPPEQQSLL